MYQIISYILNGIMMIITATLFSKIILQKKVQVSKNKAIKIIILSSIAIAISTQFLNGVIKTSIHYFIYFITIKKIYNIDYWKAALLSIIYLIILMITESLFIIILLFVIKMSRNNFYTYLPLSPLPNATICIGSILISNFIKKFLRNLLNYKLDNNKKIIILLSTTSLCTFYCFYEAFTNVKIDKDFYINVGIIIVFLIVLFNLVKQLIINSKKTMEYDKLLEFMKNYEEDIENERILRHETKNQLLTIKAKIYDKEKDKDVIKYIDSILDEKIEVSQEHYAKFQYLPANGLKALFYFKTSEAEKKKIKVSINISKRVENSILYNLNTKEFKQLGRLLGIYLDNAIEASEESKEKVIGIEIYLIKENIEIIISNSYEQKEKISINGKSSKGKKRGHGLILANNIINSSSNLEVEKTITEKLYIQKLIIKDNYINKK